jgi:hypothetical protein
MQVYYIITKFGKKENSEFRGIGSVIGEHLVISGVSTKSIDGKQKTTNYTKVLENAVKSCNETTTKGTYTGFYSELVPTQFESKDSSGNIKIVNITKTVDYKIWYKVMA